MYLPTLQKNQYLSEILQAFPDVSFVGDVHIVVVHILHCKLVLDTSQRFTCAYWAPTHTTLHKFLRAWKLIIISLPLWRIHSWLPHPVPHELPVLIFLKGSVVQSRRRSAMNADVMKAETQYRWSHDEPNAFKRVVFALDHRAARTRPSRSTFAEETEKDKIDPPIHTGYVHTGEANTLNFILCSWKQNSDPTLDSAGRMKHPNPKRRFALRSGFLKLNMPRCWHHKSLLRSSFPELSSTWCLAFWSREINDVEQTKKIVPCITRETVFGQHVRNLVLSVSMFD